MSAETIYMPLLDEGTDVWAPVLAEAVGMHIFRVLGPMPADEDWQFKPGELVVVELKIFAGGEKGLAAARKSTQELGS